MHRIENTMENADIVIVGGGIAGLGTAYQLSIRTDLSIVLIEQDAVGDNKTTPVTFPDHLETYHIKESVNTYYSQHVLQSYLGGAARYDYKHKALASIDYSKACNILLKTSQKNGLKRIKAKAQNFYFSKNNKKNVLVLNLNTKESISTQILVDATGYRQWGAGQLGLDRSPYYSVCIGETLSNCSHKQEDAFWFLAPSKHFGNGGGWYYPLKDGRASMGYAQLLSKPVFNKSQLREGFNAAKREFNPFAYWVRDAQPERLEYGIIPVGNLKRFVDDRFLIIGDAAGQAIPWTMMGFDAALKNGILCSDVILDAFKKGRFDKKILGQYEKLWKKNYQEPFWRTMSHIEPVWLSRTDEDWDSFFQSLGTVPAEQQLKNWRYDHVAYYQKIYAVLGYYRRRLWRKIFG